MNFFSLSSIRLKSSFQNKNLLTSKQNIHKFNQLNIISKDQFISNILDYYKQIKCISQHVARVLK